MNILVVGGAGYIGSHCVRQLVEAGHQPVVLDTIEVGHRQAVPEGIKLYENNLGDQEVVGNILEAEAIDLVMHFAAYALVGESVENPIKYYRNNVVETLSLLEVMLAKNIKQFVFSSTCATYGVPDKLPITENTPQFPINPYGQTKLDVENILKALAHSHGLSSASFRYFNAAGAAEDGTIGEDRDPETHLIPLAIQAAQGKRDALKIFGTDYDTPDGTCLRDYIHVDDLACAHIAVFEKLQTPGQVLHYNLGTGTPNSVREVIDTVERVSGLKVPVQEVARRPGDPPSLYADASKAKSELNWELQYPTLESIIKTAWKWHCENPEGFSQCPVIN